MKTKQNRNHPGSGVPKKRRIAYQAAVRGPTMHEHVARLFGCMTDCNAMLASGDFLPALGATLEANVCGVAIAAMTPADANEHGAKIELLRAMIPKFDGAGQYHIARLIDVALAFETTRDVDGGWANGRH